MSTFNVKLSISAFLIASIVCADCAADATEPHAVATVRDVMLGLTIPTSDFIWGIEEEPADAFAWEEIRLNAVMLAESGNLLMAEGRAREGDTWASEARALVDAASVAITAAEAKDLAAVIDSGEAIYNTCEACHRVYLLPSAE